jgi:hypothetical protein
MARNRKNQSAAIQFGPALTALVLCLLSAGAGVGYVWQKDQIDRLGQLIHRREVRLNELIEENENRKKQLANLHSVGFLEKSIKDLGLGLAQPQPNQIWRLAEPARERPKLTREQLYAAQEGQAPITRPTNEPLSQ